MRQPVRASVTAGVHRRSLSRVPVRDLPLATEVARTGMAGAVRGRRADSVSVSARVRSLQRLFDWVADSSDVRPTRVEALQRRVAEGTYRVDAETLARRLIEDGLIS